MIAPYRLAHTRQHKGIPLRMTAETYPHPLTVRLAMFCYEWLWQGATPLLRRNQRLREGLPQRLGKPFPQGPFDIWIQAASAGEAYLAGQLLESIASVHSFSFLVTTNTRQGYDIIDATLANLDSASNGWLRRDNVPNTTFLWARRCPGPAVLRGCLPLTIA